MDNQGANLLRMMAGLMKSGMLSGALQNISALQNLSKAGSGGSPLGNLSALAALAGGMQQSGAGTITETVEQEREEKDMEQVYFAQDETGSSWRREERVDLLIDFCREGYAQAKRHGHFLIGTAGQENYIAIPGRFLVEDQPAGGKTGFTLWQPLRGGEELCGDLADIGEETAEMVYGYWIARLNGETLEVSEV